MLLLITDQQRAPQHWPNEPGWLRALTPADHELARTGLSFRRAFCATCMCSPSRATLLTGDFPSRHGVTLTLTAADLRPDPRNVPAVFGSVGGMLRDGHVSRRRVLRQVARTTLPDPRAGGEPELHPYTPTLGKRLRAAGYHVEYRGKWHLTQPANGEEWSERDSEILDQRYGFGGWVAPDAGENAKAEHFGGGNAGRSGMGWDEDYTRQAEELLATGDLPEPFCLIVSLVNPHDVLGYPSSYLEGGYQPEEFRDLGVELPTTVDESLATKPGAQGLSRLGMTAYLGPLNSEREQLDYVNFYAYLHRLVDEKIGRVLAALGDAGDPDSLRSRTVIVRCADHGEMGLSHGGLRQKAFNAYEETIRVPLIVSNPVLFPEARETDALASLADVTPTMLDLAGAPEPSLQGRELTPILARHCAPQGELHERSGIDARPLTAHPAPADTVQDAVHFTYDDHQAATATTNGPGQPNRLRAVRDGTAKYVAYLDPAGEAAPEYELYDVARDPCEAENLVDFKTGEVRRLSDQPLLDKLQERLRELSAELETELPFASQPRR
jgi:arylsulfatase A-like enzyme